MSKMHEQISVEALRKVSVLYEGDIYELAQLLLKVNDASDRVTHTISRHTVQGLASAYCYLANLELRHVIAVFARHGLPLGATVEHAHDIAAQNRSAGT